MFFYNGRAMLAPAGLHLVDAAQERYELKMKHTFTKKLAGPFLYLFWKTQIDILNACPPLQGAVFMSGIGSDRSARAWFAVLLKMLKEVPAALLAHARDIRGKRIALSNVTLWLTERCTLRCDKCLVRIPDTLQPSDPPASEILSDLRRLFSFADQIYAFNITGGEPFLYAALDEIVLACAASGKIARISVATNGTVLPGEALLAALRAANATVRISKYAPELQPQVETLKRLLESNSVAYLHESGAFWYDLGDPDANDRRGKQRFRICSQRLCLIYRFGKLFRCIQTATQMKNGLPTDAADYIDLRAAAPASYRAAWRALRTRRGLSACSRCLGFTYKTPRIPVAAQR